MAEFLLAEGFLGGKTVEIDEDRFNEILYAKNVIKPIWEVEDTFALLANAFIEFEEYLISVGIRYFYQRDMQRDADHFFDDVRQNLNLKLISVLTASRMYEEQLHRRMSSLSKLVGEEIDLRSSFRAVFDGSLEYRVMYALRNHALHNQLPLGAISIGDYKLSSTGNLRDDAPTRLRITVDPKISVEDFCNSDKINARIRDEVNALGFRHLDLKFFARGFLMCLARCHQDFREATESVLEDALDELHSADHHLQITKGELPKYTTLICRKGEQVEGHDIDYSKNSRIVEIRKYWSGLRWIQRGYISSEVKASKNTYPRAHEEIWIAD
ncbi:hypothetical protein [Ruegeria atlantica]|uniref:hypothetical protein n=1 Tax=Ruegeria atlantica TaxID=81569 RepID=UPI00147A049E|nr:hypothetical protein [Ruegeria atlantica]